MALVKINTCLSNGLYEDILINTRYIAYISSRSNTTLQYLLVLRTGEQYYINSSDVEAIETAVANEKTTLKLLIDKVSELIDILKEKDIK